MTIQLTVEAELYYSGLSDHFIYISNNLGASRSFSFVKEKLLRSNFESHAIYYRQEDKAILILRVLHQRMDPLRHIT